MQRDILLLTEMIDAAEQAQDLTGGISVAQLEGDRRRRDALLWNCTVLGEAAAQISDETKTRFPGLPGGNRHSYGTASSMVTGRLTSKSCIPPLTISFQISSPTSGASLSP